VGDTDHSIDSPIGSATSSLPGMRDSSRFNSFSVSQLLEYHSKNVAGKGCGKAALTL